MKHCTGKRSASLKDEFRPNKGFNEDEQMSDSLSSSEAPIPFSWTEHGPRLRRQAQNCNPDDVQHVLFVLDSSGSIGASQYQRMKDAIGKLVPLFCKQVKFAMVTFSTNINLEFCFDCFENTFLGREAASKAIGSADYHRKATNTGATTKCICEDILGNNCGITSNPSCLDVVYITDGKSNDRTYEVCKEVECLHSRYGINTYAIGIDSNKAFGSSFNQAELDCISDSSNILSAFEYNSFEEFEDAIEDIIDRLINSIVNGNFYACVQRDETIDPDDAVE